MNTNSLFNREQAQLVALEQRKAQTLAQSGRQPLVHALDKIIQKCLLEEGRKKRLIDGKEIERDIQIPIDYLDMPRSEISEVRLFFSQLQEAGCFEQQECVGNWVFSVIKPDIGRLQIYREELQQKLDMSGTPSVSNQQHFPPDVGWENITMRFLNGEEVLLQAQGSKPKHTTCEEMGFMRANGTPTRKWELLREISEHGGQLTWSDNYTINHKLQGRVRTQVKELRKSLKAYFQIDDDPFHKYTKQDGYRLKMALLPEAADDVMISDIELHRREQSPEIAVLEHPRDDHR